jgi:hypothetical protein
MRRRYGKVHKDFRLYAEDALPKFKADMDDLIARIAAQNAPVPSP